MRKGIQKKRLALLLVWALAIGQIPSGYVNAESTSIAQENTQEIGSNEESESVTTASEVTDNNATSDQVIESVITGETEESTPNSNTSDETKTDSSLTNKEQNISDDTNEEISPTNTEDISPQSSTIDADGFIIDGTTLRGYEGDKTSITIPNTVTIIADNAFNDDTNLISIIIPNTVTCIGEYSFAYCESLTSIIIPDSVTCIGDAAFRGCESLTSITLPNSLERLGDSFFESCRSLTNVTIPNSVETIGKFAFSDCESLTKIMIPNSVTSIGAGAFYCCINLSDIVLSNKITIIEEATFSNCEELTNITIPDSVTSIGSSAFGWCSSLLNITIPDSVTSIENEAFRWCTNLSSITIPNSVTSVENWTFYGCSSLVNITIPSSVNRIGDSAFHNCTSLASIVIPDSVNYIGKNAFAKCKGGNVKKVTSGQAIVSEEDYFVIYCSLNSYAYSYAQENRAYGILAVTSQDTSTINVESVTLNQSIVTLTQGDTITLTATVSPKNASNKNVKWSTSDSNVASVDNSGKVTALSVGTVTVTATTEDGNKTASCTIYISEPQTKVSSIKLNSTKVTLAKKAAFKLTATVSPTSATNSNVTWSSSNEKIATVTSSGKVTAISSGSAIITAVAQDGSNVSSTCKITVPKGASYKITYKLNKGTNADANPSYYATGSSIKLKKPTRKNYTFAGWYIGDKKVTSISKTTKGKITLTAKWDKVTVNKTTVKTAKNSKAGKIAVTFDKVSGVKGYTLYYSTNKKLKNPTTIDVSAKKKSATITGVTKGTTYYVTVKAYKIDSQGNKIFGKSNKTFTVKVKK